ncbi:MAG: hypothetical protein LBK95_02240 [Bifidobacteriaceae bacterium]|nr:hypothetical protein [Bifidobacteriaceae bacterium]
MKTAPSALTPLVRSDAVGAILGELFSDPDAEPTIAEVARRTNVLPAVAHKEIGRLVAAQVLTDRRQGNNRLVRVNSAHPLHRPMSEILAATYGPVPTLRAVLKSTPGVDAAFIYGSWAARRAGEPGAFPRDLDVMVIGSVEMDDLIEAQQTAHERTGLEVNMHRVTPEAWAQREANPFLATVASRPLVWIIQEGGAQTSDIA